MTETIWLSAEIGSQVNVTVTVRVTHTPAVYVAPPAIVAATWIVGEVLTMLMWSKVDLVVFPAASVHVPSTDWLAPELVTVTCNGFVPVVVVVDAPASNVKVETPELPSVQLNVTVTSWPVLVPATYGVVPVPSVAVVAIDGATESIQTSGVWAVSTLFARSDAKYEIVVLPCAVTDTDLDAPGTTVGGFVCAPVEENEMSFTPDVSSVAVSAIVTDPLAQLPNVYDDTADLCGRGRHGGHGVRRVRVAVDVDHSLPVGVHDAHVHRPRGGGRNQPDDGRVVDDEGRALTVGI